LRFLQLGITAVENHLHKCDYCSKNERYVGHSQGGIIVIFPRRSSWRAGVVFPSPVSADKPDAPQFENIAGFVSSRGLGFFLGLSMPGVMLYVF
jgi:hypothetical protein